MQSADDTARDLLFGLLALRNGLINQVQLMLADVAFPADPLAG
jgi:hypothetical protein